jgi:HSP20 family protein
MTTIVRYEPYSNFFKVRNTLDRMYEESFGPARDNAAEEFRLPVDAYVTENDIVIQASLPGVAPEAVTISVEGDSLTISAELPARLETETYSLTERAHGKFSRKLLLNVDVEPDKAEAHFDNGLLTLRLPKAETVKPKQIKVTVK